MLVYMKSSSGHSLSRGKFFFIQSKYKCYSIYYGEYTYLYNNKINTRVLIGQSAIIYCAGNMEKSHNYAGNIIIEGVCGIRP